MSIDPVLNYLAYLEGSCQGEDRHEFWNPDGSPDLAAARFFAEQMRKQMGGFLHDFVEIEQRVNVVRVRALHRELIVVR